MLKRFLSLMIAVFMVAFCPKTFAVANDKTHYIAYPADMELLYQYPEDTFYLVGDIYLEDPWQVCCPTNDKPFSGTLDGQGYAIYYAASASDAEAVALFGYLTGTVKSLTVARAEIKATSKDAVVAGIAAYNYGSITDCKFDGKIYKANEELFGVGICGVNKGSISNCIDKTAKPQTSSTPALGGDVSSHKPNENPQVENPISSTSSTYSIITQIDHNNSSETISKPQVPEDDRQNAVEYFDELNSKPKERASGAVTIIVCSIAAVALAVVFAGSLYQEIKANKREKLKNKAENDKE